MERPRFLLARGTIQNTRGRIRSRSVGFEVSKTAAHSLHHLDLSLQALRYGVEDLMLEVGHDVRMGPFHGLRGPSCQSPSRGNHSPILTLKIIGKEFTGVLQASFRQVATLGRLLPASRYGARLFALQWADIVAAARSAGESEERITQKF